MNTDEGRPSPRRERLLFPAYTDDLLGRVLATPWCREDPAFRAEVRRQVRAQWAVRLQVSFASLAGSLHGLNSELRQTLSELSALNENLLSSVHEALYPAALVGRLSRDRHVGSLVMLGYSTRGAATNPFLCTALRELPAEVAWEADPEADHYQFQVFPGSGDAESYARIVFPPAEGESRVRAGWPLEFPIEAGEPIEWSVTPFRGDEALEEFGGLLWISDPELLTAVDQTDLQFPNADDPAHVLARAAARLDAELWGEAEAMLLSALAVSPGDASSVPQRRVLAELYNRAKNRLFNTGGPSLELAARWMAKRGEQQLMLLACVLLHNYDRFEADECGECGECGMVPKKNL